MCKIGHRTDARKSSITNMPQLQALSRMLKMRSLCLITKNSSTTRKKRSFPLTSLVNVTFTVSSSRSIRKSIISPHNTSTQPSNLTKKTSSRSITPRLINSKSAIRSCRGSRTWKVHSNCLEIKFVTRRSSVIKCALSVNRSIWSAKRKIKI